VNPDIAFLVPGGALAASVGLNALLAQLGRRLGWCDQPGDPLKTHATPVPFVGGVGLLAVLLLAVLPAPARTWQFAAVAAIALGVGLWDDFRWKSVSVPFSKLLLQTVAAGAGVILLGLGGLLPRSVPTALAGPAAVLLLLGAMNSWNLEDGMDGVCAGEAALSALGFALVLRRLGSTEPALVALVFAAALAGFLVLNWHPAHLFLGDGGSHLTGALLGSLALTVAAQAGAAQRGGLAWAGAVLMLGLPVVDTTAVIVRRMVRHRPLFAGDRGHLYDLLNRRGLSVGRTAVAMYALHALLVVAGVVLVVVSGSH
jgi:UDP-GlcNAc:undecaprenyl-phosphate GlcNAc-1-phosphate transferase